MPHLPLLCDDQLFFTTLKSESWYQDFLLLSLKCLITHPSHFFSLKNVPSLSLRVVSHPTWIGSLGGQEMCIWSLECNSHDSLLLNSLNPQVKDPAVWGLRHNLSTVFPAALSSGRLRVQLCAIKPTYLNNTASSPFAWCLCVISLSTCFSAPTSPSCCLFPTSWLFSPDLLNI